MKTRRAVDALLLIVAAGAAYGAVSFLMTVARSSAALGSAGLMVRLGLALALVVLTAASVYGLRRGPTYRRTLLLGILLAYGPLLVADVTLKIQAGPDILLSTHALAARAEGAPFDERSRLEVVLDLRSRGVRAFPYAPPAGLKESGLPGPPGERFAPIAGVAHATTVYCNEMGDWLVNVTDRYGFNNPDSVWDSGPEQEVVVIGDSVAQGMCLPSGGGAVDRIRDEYPRTVNLGYSGNGPLLELASLREMSRVARGRNVVWMFFPGNDPGNLSREWVSPYLQHYFESGYSQGLIERREVVQTSLVTYLENQIAAQTEPPPAPPSHSVYQEALDTLRLMELRERIRSRRAEQAAPAQASTPSSDEILGTFWSRLVDRMFQDVSDQGAELVFVYLPAFREVAERSEHVARNAEVLKARVFEPLEERGVALIDAEQIFLQQPDPASLFPFRIDGHYTEEGYGLIADAILSYLAEAKVAR